MNSLRTGVARWWPSALLAISGTVFSFLAYVHLRGVEDHALRATLEANVQDHLRLMARAADGAIGAVLSTADVLSVRPEMPRSEFEQLGQLMLARQPSLSSLGYSQWTPITEVENLLISLEEEGYSRVRAVHGQTGTAEQVGEEPVHELVLTHLVPSSIASAAIGGDVLRLPARREVVLQARDTGAPAMTGPVRLGGRSPEEAGLLVFAPVYSGTSPPETLDQRRRQFSGMVSMGLLVGPMLQEVLPEPGDGPLLLMVIDAASGSVLFNQRNPDLNPADIAVSSLSLPPLAIQEPLEMAGRTWDIIAMPTPGFFEANSPVVEPELVLKLSLAITLLMVGMVVLRRRNALAVEQNLIERTRAAADLGQANDALQKTNQEMEEFVTSVSHDLRNPLQSIMMVSQALQLGLERRDLTLTDGAVIGTLQKSVQAMNRMVDGLLEHSRAGWAPMAKEKVDLNEIARCLIAESAGAIEVCGARVEIMGLPVIEADPHRLTAALDNLIANALKHGGTTPGGQQPVIRIGARVLDDEVAIYVSDNGPGVPPEDRERIFRVFQRMVDSGEGTGLGLAIVDRAARAHGGRTWVEDTPGGGATFVIVIPGAPVPEHLPLN